MPKSKKNNNKAKLNLTVRDEQRNKLEQMASLEKRSVSNLIEVMADERWARLAEQQGIAYAKTVADAMNLKLDMDNPTDREKLRRAILDLVAERKMPEPAARG
jgi:predicted CopG family antitoxin